VLSCWQVARDPASSSAAGLVSVRSNPARMSAVSISVIRRGPRPRISVRRCWRQSRAASPAVRASAAAWRSGLRALGDRSGRRQSSGQSGVLACPARVQGCGAEVLAAGSDAGRPAGDK